MYKEEGPMVYIEIKQQNWQVSKGAELETEAHVIFSQGVVDSMPQIDRSSARLTSEVEARNPEKGDRSCGWPYC
jgi:hypothetical protein